MKQLEKTDQLMQERKSLFNRMWEEEQQRITTEQAIFKEQVRKNDEANDDDGGEDSLFQMIANYAFLQQWKSSFFLCFVLWLVSLTPLYFLLKWPFHA